MARGRYAGLVAELRDQPVAHAGLALRRRRVDAPEAQMRALRARLRAIAFHLSHPASVASLCCSVTHGWKAAWGRIGPVCAL